MADAVERLKDIFYRDPTRAERDLIERVTKHTFYLLDPGLR